MSPILPTRLIYRGKADANGVKVSEVGDPFPNEYFLIINMYNPGEYLLDDICIEEGVTFNEATYSGSTSTIKLDFGYPTNIAALASANNGSFTLDPSCVKVTINGVEATAEFVEGKSDGFLYIFMPEDVYMGEDDDVRISFTPAADCPIVYTDDKRPSADVESEMKVLGFQNEKAYSDDAMDAPLPSAWSPATMVSSIPENESFEIPSASLTNIAVTYDKALSLSTASATLTWKDNFGEKSLNLSTAMSLSEDGKTINIAVSNLSDAEYTLTLSSVENSYGYPCDEDQVITFSVGEDHDTSTSEVVYQSDFDNGLDDGVPQGWLTKDATGIHQYGFMDEDQTIQYRYGWGHATQNPNGTEGGARLYPGFSGDFQKALYWCSRDTNVGYTSYGEIVKDYIQDDGSIAENAPEGIALVLEPRKYQVSFTMAAWKGEPVFRFTLEDLEGNVYAQFNDYVAKPNMNGNKGNVTGSLKCTTDFTVDKAGYYVLKFAAQDAPWQEFLLANVKLITMPSKAAYWKQQLAAAVEQAEPILEAADMEEYNGDTKTAFAAAINTAKTGHFTAPSEIQALINQLSELGTAMQARVTNIDAFNQAIENADLAYLGLEGKYLDAEIAVTAKEMLDTYKNTNPSELSDENLAEVTPKLVTAAAQLGNVTTVVDILAWGGYKAFQTAETLGADGSAALNLTTDDRNVVNQVNIASTVALYQMLAESPVIADSLKTTVNYEAGTKIVVDGVYTDMSGEEVAASGIDFTGLIQNPRFYTFTTDGSADLQDNTVVGWNCEQLEGGHVHLANGASATEAQPVITSAINAYAGGAEYKFYQVIENVPVGVYDVYFATRTAIKNNPDGEGVKGVFNAMDDVTGIWDKYIFAQAGDEEPIMVPFAAGNSWFGHPTVIPNVTVKEGQTLTIGVVENYISGMASGHDFDAELGEYTATDRWNTNTFAGEARLYFAAPLEGYDYAKAAQDLLDGVKTISNSSKSPVTDIFSATGIRLGSMQKGVNIVRRADGSAAKILVK